MKKINLTNLPVYYINLKEDVEKSKNFETTMKDLGFKNVNRFDAIKDEFKKVGVAKSHNKLLKELSSQDEPFIVFEDDVDVFNFKPTISVPDNSDAFYLGNSIFGLYSGKGIRKVSAEKYKDEVYRIYNMLAAHAIVYLNKDYVKFLAMATEFNIAIETNQDKARAETMKYWNIYCNNEPMFYQKGVHGPVTKKIMSKLPLVGPKNAYG